MHPQLRQRLDRLGDRLRELDGLLALPEATADLDRYRRLAQEHAELEQLLAHYRAWQQAQDDLEAARAWLEDPEMRELAQEEARAAQSRIEREEAELTRLLLPRDPNDARNLFLEIRAGTGGHEAALFAGDL
ncbi:MAG: PCRF domain-containing protein, partial [Thiobacillaceae bacterium]|nr:PCRF domain-containing protein [Thiobacillaceae bacterium]